MLPCSICAPCLSGAQTSTASAALLAASPRQTGVIKTALLNGSSNGRNLFVMEEQVSLKINHLRKRQTVLWWSRERFGKAGLTEGTGPCLMWLWRGEADVRVCKTTAGYSEITAVKPAILLWDLRGWITLESNPFLGYVLFLKQIQRKLLHGTEREKTTDMCRKPDSSPCLFTWALCLNMFALTNGILLFDTYLRFASTLHTDDYHQGT